MKAAFIHLSDLHFEKASDLGLKRCEKLANTILFAKEAGERIFIIVTGDIANKGLKKDYSLAKAFFEDLRARLSLQDIAGQDAIVLIPGNHDCDFTEVGDLRPSLLERVPSELDDLDSKGEIARTLLQVQKPFWAFCADLTGTLTPPESQVYRSLDVFFANYRVQFRCFNSAWLSKRHEDAGSLGFPKAVTEEADQTSDASLVIALIHHPANWLTPSVHQSFRKAVQHSSDFLLSGHEHTQNAHTVSTFTGERVVHLESGPYQPRDSGGSEFSILHVDFPAKSWSHESFRWSSGAYARSSNPVSGFWNGAHHTPESLSITNSHLSFLRDPGTGFLHPRQHDLSLSDIYIYPDLRTRSISRHLKQSSDLPKHVASNALLDLVLRSHKLVIAGPADSGKTALSKMLFIDANEKYGRRCLRVCGAAFKGRLPAASYTSAIDKAISEQYGDGSHGLYAALDRDKRVLLIDDWDENPFNRDARNTILASAAEHFACVVIFCGDLFLIEEVSSRTQPSVLATFEIADIREFGFLLRGRMISKWHALGASYIDDEQVLARHVAESTRVVDTVLGRNLLPSYPVNIITLLQTYDAGAGSQNSGLGSYGQVYEALITARLAKVSLKSIDIGTKITFISRIAWLLFETSRRTFGNEDWHQVVDNYYSVYRIRVAGDALLASLLDAGILSIDDTGYRFSYGYGYCYFVAKYFQENLADLDESSGRHELFAKLERLSTHVYNQDNASITIFYVFLTKDRALISHVLKNARLICAEESEFNFTSDINFVNSVLTTVSAAMLPDTTPSENQQAYNKHRDDAGEQIEPPGDPKLRDVSYTPEIPFEQKLVFGIRYLTLMGQILRNFPGSLKADMKLELAFESYSLGLRILGSIFSMARYDADILTNDIAQILQSKMAFDGTPHELKSRAERIVVEMLREIAFGLLKRMSHSIGLQELEETYKEVAELRDRCLSSRLIDLSIHLDHFQNFPKTAIATLAEELRSNTFTFQTLRDLVVHHVYLFPTDYSTQQWIGSTLDLQVNTAAIRGSTQKLLKKGSTGSGKRSGQQ